jgi:hypothetical protein
MSSPNNKEPFLHIKGMMKMDFIISVAQYPE